MIQKRSSLRIVKGRTRVVKFYLKDATTKAPLDITGWEDFTLTMKRLNTEDDPEFVKVSEPASRYQLAYDIGQDWNAHLDQGDGDASLTDVHSTADAANDVVLVLPIDAATYIAYVNALYSAMAAHALNTGGDYHVSPDTQTETTPTAEAAEAPDSYVAATTVAEADTLLSYSVAWYNNVHRVDETHMTDDIWNGSWAVPGGAVIEPKAGSVSFTIHPWDTETLLEGGHVYDVYATDDEGSTVSVQDPAIMELVQNIG